MSTFSLTETIPPDVLASEILPRLDLKSVLRMPLVCKLLKDQITSEFLKTKCLAYFQELGSISSFIEPFVATAPNPWGWIAYSLASARSKKDLDSVAIKTASDSLVAFGAYLKSHVGALSQEQVRLKSLLNLDEHDDLEIKIEAAEIEFRENWTHEDQFELDQVGSRLKEQGDLERCAALILEAEQEVPGNGEAFLSAVKKRTVNPDFIRMAELINQVKLASWRPEQLRILKKVINRQPVYQELIDKKLSLCTTTVFSHVLCFLPHLKDWMPCFADAMKLDDLLSKATNRANRLISGNISQEEVKGLMDKLPESYRVKILEEFLQEGGDLEQMGRHFAKLDGIFKKRCAIFYTLKNGFQKKGNFNRNPIHVFRLISALVTSPNLESSMFVAPIQIGDTRLLDSFSDSGSSSVYGLSSDDE